MQAKCKSIFSSTTFWAILLLMLQALIPSVDAALTDNIITPHEILSTLDIFVSTIIAVIGRYQAGGDLYTPGWMPGKNKPKDSQ